MPALANPRHEKFARLVYATQVRGQPIAIAYKAAGFKATLERRGKAKDSSAGVCASQLLGRPRVKQRVQEIAAMAAKRNDVTVDSLVQELDEAKALAKKLDQPAAMTQAIMGKAKITGNIIERKETGQPGDFAALDDADAILALVRREVGDDAADVLKSLIGKGKADVAPTHDGSDSVQ